MTSEGTITALRQQKRNKQRVNLFVDENFVCGLSYEVATTLHVGQYLSSDDFARLADADEVARIRESGRRFLAHRPRSVREMRRNLTGKKYGPDLIQQTVDYFLQADLLDDEAFARYWVEQRENFKPRSHMALRQELMQKGIAREIVTAVLADVDEEAAAERAARKRLSRLAGAEEEIFRDKLSRFLQGRGFSYGTIRTVTEMLWSEVEMAGEES